jgi:hypothetical protein
VLNAEPAVSTPVSVPAPESENSDNESDNDAIRTTRLARARKIQKEINKKDEAGEDSGISLTPEQQKLKNVFLD